MKKLLKNLLLTTTAVAGIIVPSTIVAKQSNNYVETTSTETLTPMVLPIWISGSYTVEGSETENAKMISNSVAFFFDVNQLYDLGIISTDISESNDPEVWYTAAVEATQNIHFTGEYSTAALYWDDFIYDSGTFGSFEMVPPPLLTEDYEFTGTNPDNIVYEISDDADYLTLALPVFFDASSETDPDHHLQSLDVTINEFYYTTVEDQTTKHEIHISDLWTTNSPTQFNHFSIKSSSFDNNANLPDGTTLSYSGGEGFDTHYNEHAPSFTISLYDETAKYGDLKVMEFDPYITPWWTYLIWTAAALVVVGLVWWIVSSIRKRRKNKKQSSETKT